MAELLAYAAVTAEAFENNQMKKLNLSPLRLLLLTLTLSILSTASACSTSVPPITSVDKVAWKDIAGHPCETVTVKTNWYRGETATFCQQNNETMLVPTQHTDLTMMSGIAAGLGTALAAIIGLL